MGLLMSEAQLLIYLTSCMALAYTSSELCLNNGLSRFLSKATTWGAIHLANKKGAVKGCLM
jgi:hypothetical protein